MGSWIRQIKNLGMIGLDIVCLIFEATEDVVNFLNFFTGPDGYNSKEIFKVYDRLELIYDSEKWNVNYHLTVPDSIFEMIYSRVQPRLVVQEHLSESLRTMTQDRATHQLKLWLQLANSVKEKHTLGLRYALCSSKIFSSFKF